MLWSLSPALAAPFTVGDILTTRDGPEGMRQVMEWTRDGFLVQTIDVPYAPGQASPDAVRDVAIDETGNLVVFTGTYNVRLSTYNVRTGVWAHYAMDYFNIHPVLSTGKLAVYSHFAFATDGFMGGLDTSGVVMLDTRTNQLSRFDASTTADGPIDLTIGKDGYLYGLYGEGSPPGRTIKAFNPVTKALIKTIKLPNSFLFGIGSGNCSIAVDALGYIYLSEGTGRIIKLTPNGLTVMQNMTFTSTAYSVDMDVSNDGTMMVTQKDGRLTFLDKMLLETSTRNTTNYYSSQTFGAFIDRYPRAFQPPPAPIVWP